ncbi:hypothetical protein ABZ897_01255 [Nonomuraea sp. NPDC046802]|uniref:hypothetical protein n=1 Tax=Nonomuraea sp. NPDC046802 TaxID=3154919 RepID=UPI0034103201
MLAADIKLFRSEQSKAQAEKLRIWSDKCDKPGGTPTPTKPDKPSANDPRFRTCGEANAKGYGRHGRTGGAEARDNEYRAVSPGEEGRPPRTLPVGQHSRQNAHIQSGRTPTKPSAERPRGWPACDAPSLRASLCEPKLQSVAASFLGFSRKYL